MLKLVFVNFYSIRLQPVYLFSKKDRCALLTCCSSVGILGNILRLVSVDLIEKKESSHIRIVVISCVQIARICFSRRK